jgi:hypothetical protein
VRFNGAAWVMPAWGRRVSSKARAQWIGFVIGAVFGLAAGALAAWIR